MTQYRTINMFQSRSRWKGVPLNWKTLNCLRLFQLKKVTSAHHNRMKNSKCSPKLTQSWKRERGCSRNLLGWQLFCLRQNRYTVFCTLHEAHSHQFENAQMLFARPEWKIWCFIFWRFQSQLSWISVEDLKCMRNSELFLFRSQELVEKQARCFNTLPTAFLCFPCSVNFACVWHFLVKYEWKPCEECAKI